MALGLTNMLLSEIGATYLNAAKPIVGLIKYGVLDLRTVVVSKEGYMYW